MPRLLNARCVEQTDEMTDHEPPADWKLQLRFGKIRTSFKHFTTISEGEVVEPLPDFDCDTGPAFMGMKVWASDTDEAVDMARAFGERVGFAISRVQVYETEPEQPPRESPFGYAIQFTSYDR